MGTRFAGARGVRGSVVLFSLWALTIGGCPADPDDLCNRMAERCGGRHPDNWEDWCRGGCVPLEARTIPCDANDECLLCSVPAGDAGIEEVTYFGFPADEIEYLWTQILPRGATEGTHPEVEPLPTGRAFDDRMGDFHENVDHLGHWHVLQPAETSLEDAMPVFCEPGPNLYLRSNAAGGDALHMAALSLPPEHAGLRCPDPFCMSGPYPECGSTEPRVCQYGEEAETHGYGTASQLDRTVSATSTEIATYGYGRYRATLSAGGATTGPVSGTVYAFFSQSNLPCVDGEVNVENNTAEIDIEISSSVYAESGGMPFCTSEEMCFIVSTWTSSRQSLPPDRGTERHEVSGFRYYDRETPGELRTYGYDWRETEVRFTYDVDPTDCDDAAGDCPLGRGSVAICEHRNFVPRRPSPLHLQLWNSWWGGYAPPGTPSEMTVTHVWHEPFP